MLGHAEQETRAKKQQDIVAGASGPTRGKAVSQALTGPAGCWPPPHRGPRGQRLGEESAEPAQSAGRWLGLDAVRFSSSGRVQRPSEEGPKAAWLMSRPARESGEARGTSATSPELSIQSRSHSGQQSQRHR